MPNTRLRDVGAIIPGARAEPPPPAIPPAGQPAVPQAASPAPASPAAAPAPRGGTPEKPIFAADAPDDPSVLASDALGLDGPLELLAELASHGRTRTPLTIGLFGPAGCGKSVALNKLVNAIERLGAAAREAASSPYLTATATVRIDAADLDGDPAPALAEALYARLSSTAPGLAREAAHAARDPELAVRDAFEKLDSARLKLEAERRVLQEADTHRARLGDTLLFETPGSQIDAYAAGRRGRIKRTMASFGVSGDPLLGYKYMVADAADSHGAARGSLVLRAFWTLKGQGKLIITAIALALIGIGLGAAFGNQANWLGSLRAQPQTAGAADWMGAHASWILTLRTTAFAGAALALLLNLWRGARLLQMILHGERLHKSELLERRRDSDGHFGHQARRVEAIAADVDRLSRQAAEAERRAGGLRAGDPALAEPSPFAPDPLKQQARRFIAAVGALAHKGQAATPQRVIVALDNLDAAPAARAREILAQAQSLLGPGYVTLIAANPAGLEDAPNFDKWIQAPLQVGEIAGRRDVTAQIRNILGQTLGQTSGGVPPAAAPRKDAGQSALDEPLTEIETKLLAALAPLAGPSARAVSRFVNLYRLLRTQWRDRPEQRGALAFMLALDAGGSPAEIATVYGALGGAGGDAAFDAHQTGPRVASTMAALGAVQGRPSIDALRRAAAQVRAFSFRADGATDTA